MSRRLTRVRAGPLVDPYASACALAHVAAGKRVASEHREGKRSVCLERDASLCKRVRLRRTDVLSTAHAHRYRALEPIGVVRVLSDERPVRALTRCRSARALVERDITDSVPYCRAVNGAVNLSLDFVPLIAVNSRSSPFSISSVAISRMSSKISCIFGGNPFMRHSARTMQALETPSSISGMVPIASRVTRIPLASEPALTNSFAERFPSTFPALPKTCRIANPRNIR
jgi:hypothetical protein